MACAVVEHGDGRKTHHTEVVRGGVRMVRQKPAVRLELTDGSVEHIEGAVSVRVVADDWFVHYQLFVAP